MQKVYRYLKVYKAVLKRSLSRSYVYRLEVFSRLLRTFFIIFLQLLIINSLYGNQSDFIGYSKPETILIVGLFNILNYSAWSVFLVNLGRLEERINKGEADSLLLMPLNSIFSISLTDFFIYDFTSILTGVMLVVYYFVVNTAQLYFLSIVYGLIVFLLAFILLFSINILFASFTFIKTKNGMLTLVKELYSLSRFPTDVWGSGVQMVFMTAFPIVFLTTVPAKLLFNRLEPVWLLYAFLITGIFSVLAIYVWNRNLKKYTSFGG